MQDQKKLQGKPEKLLPLDGNCYSTQQGLFDCELIEEKADGRSPGGVKLEVRLTRRATKKNPSPTVRRFIVHATTRAVEKNRLNLVVEVHKWALSEPRSLEYLEKEVWL
jgi:hypothetical protein